VAGLQTGAFAFAPEFSARRRPTPSILQGCSSRRAPDFHFLFSFQQAGGSEARFMP
jgi:hypothetical protein